MFANWSQEQTDGTYKTLLYGPLAKFDMECEQLSSLSAVHGTRAQHRVTRAIIGAVIHLPQSQCPSHPKLWCQPIVRTCAASSAEGALTQ